MSFKQFFKEKRDYVGKKKVYKFTRENKNIQISLASLSPSKGHGFVIIQQGMDLLNSKLYMSLHNLQFVNI